jgi:hypothetical protein
MLRSQEQGLDFIAGKPEKAKRYIGGGYQHPDFHRTRIEGITKECAVESNIRLSEKQVRGTY